MCSIAILRVYEDRTKGLRKAVAQSKLYLGLIKPHSPVAQFTVARWLRSIMKKTGIDASMFKAHSARGAEVTVATNDHLHVT